MDVSKINPYHHVRLRVMQGGVFISKDDVYRANRKQLITILRYKLGDLHEAEDLMQEIFCKFCRNKYKLIEGKETALLAMIATFAVKDYRKKKSREKQVYKPITTVTVREDGEAAELDIFDVEDFGESISAEREVLLDDTKEILHQFIDTLPRLEREVAILLWMEGRLQKEIADITKRHITAVYTRISTIRKKFRDFCEENGFYPEETI